MKKAQIQILIVEDDATQGEAINALFKRAGYQTTLCNSSAQALTATQRTEFHGLIVDCMLPKMNGVDLVKEIHKTSGTKAKVIMISGIFKDKNFIKETMTATEAVDFFTKPLDLNALEKAVERAFQGFEAQTEVDLWSLYSSRPLSGEQFVQLIEKTPNFEAFHLAMLYQRLPETALTGELHMTGEQGESSVIQFYGGNVFAAKTPDAESYFGALAIEMGYVSPDDVLEALKDTGGKMLGQKLIDAQTLSPHAIQLILEEQLAMRVSETVRKGSIAVQWVPKPFPVPNSIMNGTRFESLTQDWIRSKIDPAWMRTTLESWGHHAIEGHEFEKFPEAKNFEAALKDPNFAGDADAVTIFAALLQGECFVGAPESSGVDFSYFESRLDKMLVQFRSKNHFQILGIGEKSQNLEVARAFQGLKQFFDPELLPENAPQPLREKCERLFEIVKNAYQALSDEARRSHYAAGLAKLRTQEIMNCGSIFQAAMADLLSGDAQQAAIKLQSILDKGIEIKDLRSYRIWAGLRVDKNYADITLEQIPPEDRHSAAYQMAKGVRYRSRMQFDKSLQAFRTAHVLDPKLSIAKRELQTLLTEVSRHRPDDRALIKEITQSIDALYGKKKRKAA